MSSLKDNEAAAENSQINLILPPSYDQLFVDPNNINTINNVNRHLPSFLPLPNRSSSSQNLTSSSPFTTTTSSASSSMTGAAATSMANFNLKDYFEAQLKEKYPVRYAIFHAVVLILSSILSIVLQIILIAQNGALYEVGTGIWCGCIGIFTLVFVILTIRTLKYTFYSISCVLNSVLSFVYLFGLFVINAIGVDSYDECVKGRMCYSRSMISINIVLMIVGVLMFVECLLFIIITMFIIRSKSKTNCKFLFFR